MKTTIKTLYRKGYNKTQIGQMLGIDRKTVRKVLREGESYRMKERERITSTKRRGRPKKDTGTQPQETEVEIDVE